MNPLKAISPIDGRYRDKVEKLADYFSEYALIKYRVMVEVEYFLALTELDIKALKGFPKKKADDLRKIYLKFSEKDAEKIKETEKVTNHDVKAVEYFLKDKLSKLGLSKYEEFIHFGLTSQDINNTAIPISMKDAIYEEYLPLLDQLIHTLNDYAQAWKDIPMLARTHGQPASPTRLGKEIYVFVERLDVQKRQLLAVPFSAKFGGATGNMNAHFVAYPEIDWVFFANNFVNNTLQVERSQTTTQIEHYDNAASLFDALKRINSIIMDLDRDMWTYISMDYFKQKIKKGEIGSSAMPHKVNPIDFENSEGNIGIANALFEHLAAKLPVSRLQRDLTDSTVLRNVGMPIAHSVIALQSTLKGLSKLVLNEKKLNDDLEQNWAVVAEAIQTVLRREGFAKPYEALKELTRTNQAITKQSISTFIDGLKVSDKVKKELRKISPQNFTGINMVL
jgi:adenylosuccinate lyase